MLDGLCIMIKELKTFHGWVKGNWRLYHKMKPANTTAKGSLLFFLWKLIRCMCLHNVSAVGLKSFV